MSRKGWFALIMVVLVLLITGRMVLRYLDYEASEASRQQAGAKP